MFRFVEDVCGVNEDLTFTNAGAMNRIYEGALVEAGKHISPRRTGRAPRFFTNMLIQFENVLADVREDSYVRMLCWYLLLSSWSCLRFDDSRGLSPESF